FQFLATDGAGDWLALTHRLPLQHACNDARKLRPRYRLVRLKGAIEVASHQPPRLDPRDGTGGPMVATHVDERACKQRLYRLHKPAPRRALQDARAVFARPVPVLAKAINAPATAF